MIVKYIHINKLLYLQINRIMFDNKSFYYMSIIYIVEGAIVLVDMLLLVTIKNILQNEEDD